MYFHDISALISTILTISAFFPQIFKVLKTKSAHSLSAISFLVSYTGSIILTIYSSLERPFVRATLIVDLVISFLMLPILYFIFRDRFNKIWRYLSICIAIDIISLLFFTLTFSGVFNINASHESTFPIAIVGFACTAFAFFPQTLIVIKNRQIGDYSFLLASIYGVAQTLNVVFWIGRLTVENQPFFHYFPGMLLASISALIQFTTISCVLFYKYQKK